MHSFALVVLAPLLFFTPGVSLSQATAPRTLVAVLAHADDGAPPPARAHTSGNGLPAFPHGGTVRGYLTSASCWRGRASSVGAAAVHLGWPWSRPHLRAAAPQQKRRALSGRTANPQRH